MTKNGHRNFSVDSERKNFNFRQRLKRVIENFDGCPGRFWDSFRPWWGAVSLFTWPTFTVGPRLHVSWRAMWLSELYRTLNYTYTNDYLCFVPHTRILFLNPLIPIVFFHCCTSSLGPTVFRGPRGNPAELGFFPRNLSRGIWAAEFTAELAFFRGIPLFLWNFSFCPGIWRFSFEQLFFHRKWPQSSSVTSLFVMIFCLMVMVEWWKWWLMNE